MSDGADFGDYAGIDLAGSGIKSHFGGLSEGDRVDVDFEDIRVNVEVLQIVHTECHAAHTDRIAFHHHHIGDRAGECRFNIGCFQGCLCDLNARFGCQDIFSGRTILDAFPCTLGIG